MELICRLILLVALFTRSHGLSAKEYFDEVEVNIQLIVKKVEENVGNECALLRTCAAVANCSRYDCFYDVTDMGIYTCQPVNANRHCHLSEKCSWRNFNFRKSSISASPTTDISSNETTKVICTHRELDMVFPIAANKTNGNHALFGSVEGTSRIYPGRDESPCKNYDPRVRPWYLASLYVKKVVMVVIDVGFLMGEPMIAGDDKAENPLVTAQNLTKALFNTLSVADFINIVVYNASDATLLAPNPVAVNDSNSDTYPPSHPEFGELTMKLMNTAVGSANAGVSNFSLAMDTAILNMSPFKPEFLKVALVLTNGALGDSTSPIWKKVKAAGVKTFVYKFQASGGTDNSASETLQVCGIGGSYEPFPIHRRQNPLFAMQSYFSFISNVRSKMNNSLVYGFVYADYFDADSEIFTISQSVYNRNGVLVGVVGLDIHKSDIRKRLGITDSDFEAETTKRHIAYTFNATRDLVLDCTNQTPVATSCGLDISVPPNGSLCAANDQGRSIAEFSCCNGCKTSDGRNEDKSLSPAVWSVIVVASVIVCVVVGVGAKKLKDRRSLTVELMKIPDQPPAADSTYYPPAEEGPGNHHVNR